MHSVDIASMRPDHRSPGALAMSADTLPAACGDIAALNHPVLVRLAAYWRSLCHDDRLPRRRDINPAGIVRAMPFVALVDVHGRDPLTMTYRLIGTELTRWIGRDNTGRSVGESYQQDVGPDWDRTSRDYERAVTTGQPAYRLNQGVRPNGLTFQYERILLPLASDGKAVDGLLVGLVPL